MVKHSKSHFVFKRVWTRLPVRSNAKFVVTTRTLMPTTMPQKKILQYSDSCKKVLDMMHDSDWFLQKASYSE